jgi:hypothetical protein
MTDTNSTDRLLTQREYAEYRRCSIRTIERERAVGTGCPYVRIGARILYRLADVDRFVNAHRIGGSNLPNPTTTDISPSITSRRRRRANHTASVAS